MTVPLSSVPFVETSHDLRECRVRNDIQNYVGGGGLGSKGLELAEDPKDKRCFAQKLQSQLSCYVYVCMYIYIYIYVCIYV